MALKDKLKELRQARGMTQSTVAEHLYVSAQTVSKWERGLLSPDIQLLPKIAVLYQCSIDSLFDMGTAWGEEQRLKFGSMIRALYSKKKYEEAYIAWIAEIELHPDHYEYYINVMELVLWRKMFSEERLKKMLSFARYAELYCNNDDIRNEIYRLMLQICAAAGTDDAKETARYYYNKLPLLKHSREAYAGYVAEREEISGEAKKMLMYTLDLAESSLRKVMTPEMTQKEKRYYYKKAADLYETVLDDRYGGVCDLPLIADYVLLTALSVEIGDLSAARAYMKRIEAICERHLLPEDARIPSPLLDLSSSSNISPNPQKLILQRLGWMQKDERFEIFREELASLKERIANFIS